MGIADIWWAVRQEVTCSISIGLAAAVGDKALRVVANTCAEDGVNERVEGGVFAQVTPCYACESHNEK